IAEEHAFAKELAEHEIPVVAPSFTGEHARFSFAVYPRRGGRSPELEDRKTLEWIGRFVGRIHAVGAARAFQSRESLNAKSFGHEPRSWQLSDLLAGYEDFMPFERRELPLLEALRTLRLIHYSAWLARRWDDPAFPAAFPWFGTQRYWQDRILELREQIAAMDEEPLSV